MKKLLAVLFLMLSFSVFAQSVDDLTFITEEYAPLNFEKDGKVQGIAVDTLVEMLKVVGAKKSREDVKVWPWARGYDTVQKEKNTCLFAMTRTEARDKLFKWVGPIMPSKIVLIAKKGRGIKIKSPGELNTSSYKVGVVRDDIGEQSLLKAGMKQDKLHQTNSGASAAKMLESGRVDLWAYGDSVAYWNMKELGFPTKDYEEILTLTESEQYYAFHKDTDDKIIEKLQSALNQLKAEGKLNEIIAAYR